MEASTILPIYSRCVCGKELTHDDFILYMLEAGLTRQEIFNSLEFISIQLDCCIASYEGLAIDTSDTCKKIFGVIHKQLNGDLRKTMAVYYLYNRRVGLAVISHLLRVPEITGLTPKKGDCPTCGCIVPNKNEVKQLLNQKKELAKYIAMYDIPRSCCVHNINDDKIVTKKLSYQVRSAVRGVPVDEMDFMVCSCGTSLSASHDSSLGYSEKSVRTGMSDHHISGDCIRQAERWGLPMEIGFHCHNVEEVCCRMLIRDPSLHYLASNKYNERRSQQNFTSLVVLCK